MTKEEVLQKANDYCSEKSYDATLTNEFKEKFATFFSKKYPNTAVDDATMLADLHFNLDTAFSATSKGVTSKQQEFTTKETEYKNKIAELENKLKGTPTPPSPTTFPKEVQDQLDELKKFKNEAALKAKFQSVVTAAKRDIRTAFHKSFENFAKGQEVSLEKSDQEQADALVTRFQAIFKDTIGDIKPLAPQQAKKRDEEALSVLKTIDV